MLIHFFLIKWQEWLKEYSTKLSQNISTWNYIPFAVSYQNTLLKPENPTQGHMTSRHKDVKYATKTSSYATKTSIRHMDGVPRYQCHKDYSIWLGNHMSRSKGKNMKSSLFTWNQNIVQFQVVSQKPLKYPIYSQGSQIFQNHFLSITFSISQISQVKIKHL